MVWWYVLPEPAVTVPVLAGSSGVGTVVEGRVVQQVPKHPTAPALALRPPAGGVVGAADPGLVGHRSANGDVSAASNHVASKTSRRGAQPVMPTKAEELTRRERVTGSS